MTTYDILGSLIILNALLMRSHTNYTTIYTWKSWCHNKSRIRIICNSFVCLFCRFTKVDCMFPLMLLFYWIVSLAICVVCPSEAINLRFTSVSWLFFLSFEVFDFFSIAKFLFWKWSKTIACNFQIVLNIVNCERTKTCTAQDFRLEDEQFNVKSHTSKHVHIHIEWNETRVRKSRRMIVFKGRTYIIRRNLFMHEKKNTTNRKKWL